MNRFSDHADRGSGISAGQADMLPTERGDVSQEIVGTVVP